MSNWPDSFIGGIVVAGYMTTYHESIIYLHDSQGKRWAEIDPHGTGIKVTIYRSTKTGKQDEYIAMDRSDALTYLEEHA